MTSTLPAGGTLLRSIFVALAVLVSQGALAITAEAAPYGSLRFFAEPGPPPASGVDPLLGSCLGSGALTEARGTHKCDSARGLDHARSLDVSPDGNHVYVGSVYSGTIGVFDRNRDTGKLTQKAGADGCIDDTGDEGCTNGRSREESIFVRVSPDGKYVYATARLSNSVTVFARDHNPTSHGKENPQSAAGRQGSDARRAGRDHSATETKLIG